MAPTPIGVIRQSSQRYGLDPASVLAYALTQGGTSWGAVGDNGSSFGPFQAHIGGAAGNRTPQAAASWANSPQGIDQMVGMMARDWQGPKTGPDAAAFIVGPHFGRGANPASDIAKARAAYPRAQALLGGQAQAPVTSAMAPPGAQPLPSAAPPSRPQLPKAVIQALRVLGGGSGLEQQIGKLAAPAAPAAPAAAAPAASPAAAPQTQQPLPKVEVQGKVTPRVKGAVTLAQQYLGTPYVWGGTKPGGFDCSGLLQYVWGKVGVNIPRVTYDQFKAGTAVPKSQLRPGDAVFFTGSDPKNGLPGHVGMFLGGGKFIEAPHTGSTVRISELAGRSDFVGARRYA